ncbi:MAG: FAD-dependent oxidoreductase [Desulfobacula sp.]|nr:FAD-dependent oxidoreductase [Desulfobacula sp.]
MNNPLKYDNCDVAIIGAGPAGLAAATALKKEGIGRVLVLEREAQAGGIPRHCGHPPFGVLEYARVMTGPSYAKKNVKTAREAGVDIALKTSVTQLGPKGELDIVSPMGRGKIKAKRVLLATGVRETPRSARLVSGNRMIGIHTTGSLQSMVYLKNLIPFRNPVVVGTEIVSFSALFTCKKAGIKPVAMVEEKIRPSVLWPLHKAARLFNVPLYLNSQLIDIIGKDRVKAVLVCDGKGDIHKIVCDGVLFTGLFTPESALVRMSHLKLDYDTRSPVIDKFGHCSDMAYYAAGNLLQPLNNSANCWRQGRRTARFIAQDLITCRSHIKGNI